MHINRARFYASTRIFRYLNLFWKWIFLEWHLCQYKVRILQKQVKWVRRNSSAFINDYNNVRFNAITRLAGVSKFWSNSLSPFLSIVRILSSHAISFQILINFHNLTYLGTDVSTHDMTILRQTTLNYIFNLHNTHPITKNISRYPINQSHPTHHPYTANARITWTIFQNVSFSF